MQTLRSQFPMSRAQFELLVRARELGERLGMPGRLPSALLQILCSFILPHGETRHITLLQDEGYLEYDPHSHHGCFRINLPDTQPTDLRAEEPLVLPADSLHNLAAHWEAGERFFREKHLRTAPGSDIRHKVHVETTTNLTPSQQVSSTTPDTSSRDVPFRVLCQILADHVQVEREAGKPLTTVVSSVVLVWHAGEPRTASAIRHALTELGLYEIYHDGDGTERWRVSEHGRALVDSESIKPTMSRPEAMAVADGSMRFVVPFTRPVAK